MNMNHIPYNILGTKDKSGFMVGFCDYKINNLLTAFKFEDRMACKVLNYQKLEFSSIKDAKKVNYKYLKSKIDKDVLLQWENEITQKVEDFKNRVNEHLQRNLC